MKTEIAWVVTIALMFLSVVLLVDKRYDIATYILVWAAIWKMDTR